MDKEQILPKGRERGKVSHPFINSSNNCYNFILFNGLGLEKYGPYLESMDVIGL